MDTGDFWDEDAVLTDLLFTTNMSISDIAKELDWNTAKTSQRIKQLGLEWVRRKDRKLSRGHAALTDIMKKLLPGEEVINEHHIGERLMLDIYCPKYKLAAEYHGRQHFFYSNLFHKDKYDFEQGQLRDERKIELCKEQGIALIVFRYCDKLTDDAVFERMLEAIRSAPEAPKMERRTMKGNPFYEKMKQRNSDYRKQTYRKMKNKRKNESDDD